MIRILLCIIPSFLPSLIFCQLGASYNGSFEITYGYSFFLNDSEAVDDINKFYNIDLTPNAVTYGIGLSSTAVLARGEDFDGEIFYYRFQSQSREERNINIKTYGNYFAISIFGKDVLYELKNIDLMIVPGINLGNRKILITENANT